MKINSLRLTILAACISTGLQAGSQRFLETGANFDLLAVTWTAGADFQVPAFQNPNPASGTIAGGTSTSAWMQWSAPIGWAEFDIAWNGPAPIAFNFFAYDGNALTDAASAYSNYGTDWAITPFSGQAPTREELQGVPDGASTLALLGFAFVLVGFFKRNS